LIDAGKIVAAVEGLLPLKRWWLTGAQDLAVHNPAMQDLIDGLPPLERLAAVCPAATRPLWIGYFALEQRLADAMSAATPS
jgi:hypothetical protein